MSLSHVRQRGVGENEKLKMIRTTDESEGKSGVEKRKDKSAMESRQQKKTQVEKNARSYRERGIIL